MRFLQHLFRTKPLQVIHAEENSQDLPRSLSLFDLICIGVGGTVGSGIFATTGSLIKDTAGPAAVVSWIIAGVVCIMNAFAYMELTTRIPSSGSTYAYAYHALGELPAVIGAWLLTLEYGLSGAGVARSWAGKMEEWLTEDYPTKDFHWLNLEYSNILAAVIMAFSVGVLLCGVRFGKFFVNTITSIKVAVVLFIIIAGFAVMDTKYLSPFVPPRDTENSAYGFQGIISGASLAFFGYIGFDEVCCLAAEAKNPKKIMPIAVIGVVGITMFLSVFASLVLAGMTEYTDAESFSAGFNNQGLEWAAKIVHAGETVTMPVVVLISFLAQPRLNYALACDGLMPQIFAKVDKKGNLFINTLISGAFFTLTAFIVPFDMLWDIISFGIFLSFIMSNSSLMMIRMREQSPVKAPLAIGTLVVSSFIATFTYTLGYTNHSSTVALVFSIIFFVIAGLSSLYLFFMCPQDLSKADDHYVAPLVPFLPTLSIVADFYLMSQLRPLGIQLSLAWIAAAVVSYFAYGYNNSAGRTGWSALLHYIPSDNNQRSPMVSFNEITPSMNQMIKEKTSIN